jgi:hypothetical protein
VVVDRACGRRRTTDPIRRRAYGWDFLPGIPLVCLDIFGLTGTAQKFVHINYCAKSPEFRAPLLAKGQADSTSASTRRCANARCSHISLGTARRQGVDRFSFWNGGEGRGLTHADTHRSPAQADPRR